MRTMTVDYAPGRRGCTFGKTSKKWRGEVVFQDFDLTGTFCSVRVWNQFQSLWSFLEARGVWDGKTVWFLFRLHDCVRSAHWTQPDQTVALGHGRTARNNTAGIFCASRGSSG